MSTERASGSSDDVAGSAWVWKSLFRREVGVRVSFAEEWDGLGREQSGDDATAMRLNEETPPDTGGTSTKSSFNPDLVVRNDELGKIGNIAHALFDDLHDEVGKAHGRTSAAAASLTEQDLDMGSALSAVDDAWITQTGVLKEACAHISNHLDFTKKSHQRDEEKVHTGMRNVAGQSMTPSRIADLW